MFVATVEVIEVSSTVFIVVVEVESNLRRANVASTLYQPFNAITPRFLVPNAGSNFFPLGK